MSLKSACVPSLTLSAAMLRERGSPGGGWIEFLPHPSSEPLSSHLSHPSTGDHLDLIPGSIAQSMTGPLFPVPPAPLSPGLRPTWVPEDAHVLPTNLPFAAYLTLKYICFQNRTELLSGLSPSYRNMERKDSVMDWAGQRDPHAGPGQSALHRLRGESAGLLAACARQMSTLW